MKIVKVETYKSSKPSKNGKVYETTYYYAKTESKGRLWDLKLSQTQLKALAFDFGLTDIKDLEDKEVSVTYGKTEDGKIDYDKILYAFPKSEA